MNILFVAHGSRLPEHKLEAEAFVASWHARFPGYQCSLCYLEMIEPKLVDLLPNIDAATLVVPMFLHNGWHHQHDLSKMISSSSRPLSVLPPLIENKGVLDALYGRLQELDPKSGGVLIYSHGNKAVQHQLHLYKMAQELQVKSGLPCFTACSKGEPSLEQVVDEMLNKGIKKISILPHFIFSGRWQERLNHSLSELQLPDDVELLQAEPLRAHPALLDMIATSVASYQ